jgi:hypothetical protein
MHSLRENFGDIDKQSSRAMTSLNSVVTERLRADDDVLQALSNLTSKTIPAKQAGMVDSMTIEQWCHALTMLRESETNSKIDAAITNYICDTIESGDEETSNGQPSSIAELEAELRTLREEIPSVVELVVASELRQPLQRLMQSSRQQSITSQTEWLHYVLDTFTHMINQLNLMTNHATKLHAYTAAVAKVRSAFDSLKTDDSSLTSPDPPASIVHQGPSRAAMHARSDSRTASSAAAAAAANNGTLAEQTCKRFAIPRPTTEAFKNASDAAITKIQEQYTTAAALTAELVAKAMDEQQQNVQGVMGQLYGHSRFAAVELLPREVEVGVETLDGAIAVTARGLENAEMGRHEDVKQVIAQVRDKLR